MNISGGSIDNTSGASVTLGANNAQNWNGSFTYVGSQQPLNLGTGAVTLGGSNTVTVNANTLTVGGVISGAFPLTLAGSGTLLLNGANSFTGNITINGGTLQTNYNNGSGNGNTSGLGDAQNHEPRRYDQQRRHAPLR